MLEVKIRKYDIKRKTINKNNTIREDTWKQRKVYIPKEFPDVEKAILCTEDELKKLLSKNKSNKSLEDFLERDKNECKG